MKLTTTLIASTFFLVAGFSHQAFSTVANQAQSFQEQIHSSMKKMDKEMMGAPMSGEPDRDFVTMMIPHHQGAIDMAKAILQNGKDRQIRAMAQKVITDQEREIKEMQTWLASHKTTNSH